MFKCHDGDGVVDGGVGWMITWPQAGFYGGGGGLACYACRGYPLVTDKFK